MPSGVWFMKRNAIVCLVVLLICGTALLLSLDACNYTVTPLSLGKIKHVVIVIQENRTPDNLFHDPILIARVADIAKRPQFFRCCRLTHAHASHGGIRSRPMHSPLHHELIAAKEPGVATLVPFRV